MILGLMFFEYKIFGFEAKFFKFASTYISIGSAKRVFTETLRTSYTRQVLYVYHFPETWVLSVF